MIEPANPTPAEALAIAKAVMAERYQGAAFGIAAGSLLRGDGTAHSDLDLIIVYDRVPVARRDSFLFGALPVQVFVHDEATLARFVNMGAARGRPSFPAMVAEGEVIGPAAERGERLRQAMAALLDKGPPPIGSDQVDAIRYAITEAVDDLRGDRSPAEYLAIGVMLHPRLVELALRGRGHWNATSKWVPRALAAIDPDLAERFDHAFRQLFASGTCAPLITLAEQELARHGGPLFDGDRQLAMPGPG